MSLYPSLEDMTVDRMMIAQTGTNYRSLTSAAVDADNRPSNSLPSSMYPGLAEFMGMEFTEDVIRENMPEYLSQIQKRSPAHNTTSTGLIAPVSSASPLLNPSQLNHGVRQVILCKDDNGRVGLRVKAIDKGIFVCLVTRGSPSSMAGLRFGDQILQINQQDVAGFRETKVHEIFRKAGVNNIVLAVRDRPFERTLTLHKDSSGHLGFQFKDGRINSIAINSSAARNGLLIDHNLLEVNGQNVVGLRDKEVAKVIENSGQVVVITVIPSFIFQIMIKNMSGSLMKKWMDHSLPEI